MGLDIRLPIGLMFVIIGGLLFVFGLAGDPAEYARSLGLNVNLWWGLAMASFGAVFLVLALRRPVKRRSGDADEGDATEELEQDFGLEGGDGE